MAMKENGIKKNAKRQKVRSRKAQQMALSARKDSTNYKKVALRVIF